MSKTLCRERVLARLRSSIAIAIAATCLAPDPTLADGSFVKGIVIGKNDHGVPLDGVSVQSDAMVGGRPCLLQRKRTGKKGSFRLRLDPACPFMTLRFSKAGYLDATIDVNNLAGDNDVGVIELQLFSRVAIKAYQSHLRKIIIVAIIVTSVATVAALKH